MTSGPRRLRDTLKAYRIGDRDGRYAIFSGEGAKITEGRWHSLGQPMIYSSEHYSTAMLEKLVHYNSELPDNQHFIEIAIPARVSYEVFSMEHHPGWHRQDCKISRDFGSRWFDEGRSCLLFVPSVVARIERNILINPLHPDFSAITAGLETPIWWDKRLFA